MFESNKKTLGIVKINFVSYVLFTTLCTWGTHMNSH